ncbi:MAG: hypothetical protein AAFX02_08560, partial [Pseudomonadota bacterium]
MIWRFCQHQLIMMFFGKKLRGVLENIAADKRDVFDGFDDDDHGSARADLDVRAERFEVIQLAKALPFFKDTAADEKIDHIQDSIRVSQRRVDIGLVRPPKLFGLDYKKDKVSAFLRGKDKDRRPLIVTGIGGAGKSAMLSSLVYGWFKRKQAPVVVWLDFDRALLRDVRPTIIVNEFLRQLSTYIQVRSPLPAPNKRAIRREISALRNEKLPIADHSSSSSQSYMSEVDRIYSILHTSFQEKWAAPLRKLNIALILDTIETVSPDALVMLLDLERSLNEAGLSGLRAVIAGRAIPGLEDLPDNAPSSPSEAVARDQSVRIAEALCLPERRIVLDGISDKAGADFLRQLDQDHGFFADYDDLLEDISNRLQGHPLALKILMRYVHSFDGTPKELIDEMLAEGNFTAELAQTFLYTRILDRIPQGQRRQLAHPGLVLRHLNQDLVRLVLAKPCLGKSLSEAEAHAAIQELKDQYWLVSPSEPPYTLRHRADLRRLMLPGLFAGPIRADTTATREKKRKLKASAEKVARAARDFYRDGPAENDNAFSWWQSLGAARDAEWRYYHALLHPDEPEFDMEVARNLLQHLKDDTETLPPKWRVKLNALLGRDVSLLEEDLLSGDLAIEVKERRVRAASKVSSRPKSTRHPDSQINSESVKGAQDELQFASLSLAASAMVECLRDPENLTEKTLVPMIERLAELVINASDSDLSELGKEISKDAFTHGYWYTLLLGTIFKLRGNLLPHLTERLSKLQPAIADFISSAALHGNVASNSGLFQVFDLKLLNNELVSYRVFAPRNLSALTLNEPMKGLGGLRLNQLALFALTPWDVDRWSDSTKTKTFSRLRDLFEFSDSVFKLSDVESIYRTAGSESMFSETFRKIWPRSSSERTALFGLSPELYPIIQGVLDRLEDEHIHIITRNLSERAGFPNRIWPKELKELGSGKQSRRLISPLIETADRYGRLTDLMVITAKFEPRIRIAIDMKRAIESIFFSDAFDAPPLS